MRISTRGAYGLRAMLVLARVQHSETLALRKIAAREQLSEQYLEQLFRDLRREGLVTSKQGARGGYTLAVSPDMITVGQVLRALEGPLGPMQCVLEDETECRHSEHCVTKILWQRLKDAIDDVLDNTTLADLLAAAEKE